MFDCAKHFEKKYLIPHATDKICGKTTRDYVTLSRDAVPTIFAHLPRYYTGNIPMKRKSHEKREQEKMNAKKKKSLCGILIYQDVSWEKFNGYFKTLNLLKPRRTWVSPLTKISIPFQERIIKKISYERRDYESADEKSLSYAMSRKTTKKN